jgi:para-aminobenzoate synthetase component I
VGVQAIIHHSTYSLPSGFSHAMPDWFQQLIAELSQGLPYACVLDDASPEVHVSRRWKLGGVGASAQLQRWDVVHGQAYENGQPVGSPLSSFMDLETAMNQWLEKMALRYASALLPKELPTHTGVFALWGYEAAWLLEDALPALGAGQRPTEASIRLIAFDTWYCFDAMENTLHCISPYPTEHDRLETALKTLTQHAKASRAEGYNIPPFQMEWLEGYKASLSQQRFEQGVRTIRSAIEQGEVYQANLSIQWETRFASLAPWGVAKALTQRNPSPFAGVWKSPQGWVISNSPERLVKQEADGQLSTRPIAGTRGRGLTLEADLAHEAELLSLEKERAEHMMLVDLERNDLGRISVAGSVRVDELMSIERYSHVMHVVSNVQGQAVPYLSYPQLMRAMHPGGTITGCPKIRCMQILSSLEPAPRHAYTGSMGYVDVLRQRTDMNILIRTLSLQPLQPYAFGGGEAKHSLGGYGVKLQAGAGIVYDSIPEHEYTESIRKAKAMFEALQAVQ